MLKIRNFAAPVAPFYGLRSRRYSSINGVVTGYAAKQEEPNSILKIAALISILGFLFIIIGSIIVTLLQYEEH